MNTGLWVLLWVIVALVIMGILLWAANRKPVEKSQESLIDVDALARYPHQNPLDYLADIYPVTGEYPKPLTGIQKEEEAKRAIEEFTAGSTAAPEANVERLQKSYSEAKFPDPPSDIMFGAGALKAIKRAHNSPAIFRPSVKDKTPVKRAAKKTIKPVVKSKPRKKGSGRG